MDHEISSMRHKLRSSVCCCFGGGAGERSPAAVCRGLADRIRWRRRVAVGEFGYDPLSYALNFDEGEDDYGEASAAAASGGGERFRYRSFSSRLPLSPQPAQRQAAAVIA